MSTNPQYDWHKMKLDFMASPHASVSGFMRSIGIRYNTSMRIRHCKGWKKEKEKLTQQVAENTLAKIKEKGVMKYEKALELLVDTGVIKERLQPANTRKKQKSQDFRNYFDMLRTMAGYNDKEAERPPVVNILINNPAENTTSVRVQKVP